LRIPSPIATGGGGEHFEQHVAAFALGLLLVRATPPILTDTSVVEAHLQTRHLGWHTDDLLLVGETGSGSRRKLAVQVKRTFTVSANDDDCRKTIQGMWDDFQAGDRFSSSTDCLAIAILHGTSTILHHFNSLLFCARATTDAADFRRRLSLDGYISKVAKKQNEAVQTILAEHTGAPVNADLYWRFLRAVNVLSLDLNTPPSQTEANMLSLLSHFAVDTTTSPLTTAGDTWARLLECAAQGRSIAKSYKREYLPSELLERHSTISAADGQGLSALFEHGNTVRDNIRSRIDHTYTIDRSQHVITLFDQLAEHQVVIVSGTAGSGKSALAKNLLAQIESDHPVLAFQAVEFATAHIDETLANAQTTLNEKRLFALLAGHDKMLILIEGVERLLEHSIRDAFSQLLRLASQNHTIQLVLTVRGYSPETVRSAFLEPIGLGHGVLEVPELSDDELDQIRDAVPNLAPPLRDSKFRSFLRTPYLLDMASRLNWADNTFPASAREFREKCWRELIRANHFTAGGLPQRRERAFHDIAYRRATELRPFVKPGISDDEALGALRQDSLIKCSPKSAALFAAAHDVLEDWAILHWFDDRFATADDSVSALADAVGGYPALRRGFRLWLGEWFELNPDDAREFVLRALGQNDLPAHFRDDCLVSALLSKTAGDFLEGCRTRLAGGDSQLLSQIIHMLRVACKESPFDVAPGLPSQMLVPKGAGWVPTLQLVSSLIDDLLPEHAQLVLGLVEDWAKQVNWDNTAPDGFKEAGLIVDALLPLFHGYGFDDARKRVLEVLVKIPRAVPQFRDIIERARTCDHRDRTASDLADLVLGGLSASYVCRDFPADVISLVNARFRISEADLDRESGFSYGGSLKVDHCFGIRQHGVSEFFPASALQGPFSALLQLHPQESMAFVVDLLNHAGDWYGNQRWPGFRLESAWKITLEIPGFGAVEQWMNDRLYCLYRGRSVGPYILQSALMALEAWLLSIGKMDDVDLEAWLLCILRKSNNVMATSVVASVCVAHPKKAGRAGLALLSNREIVQCDYRRSWLKSIDPLGASFGLDPAHRVYEQERTESNSLKHRRENLESLALRMQWTDLREDVWKIIDRHRSEIPADQDEETHIWRLALHRMDLRGFRQIDPPEEVRENTDEDIGDQVYFGPGEIEPDVQDTIEQSTESLAITDRHLRLLNQAREAWEDKNSSAAVDWRTTLLAEARAVEQELGEPEELYRGGSGLVAAVCIRDHLDELDESDFQWCVGRIEFEVRRSSDCPDDIFSLGQGMLVPDRAGASVVPLLVVHDRSAKVLDAPALLSLALTHPVDEVADYAHAGVGAFLGDEHRELILRCAAAAAYRARLIATSMKEETEPPYPTDRELADRATPKVRRAIEEGGIEASVELASLDFDDWTGGVATSRILKILSRHPEREESRHFYLRIAHWLAEAWDRDRRSPTGHETRNYELEREVLCSIARFVIHLPAEEARRISAPFVDAVTSNPRGAADFLGELILAADGSTDDCFWDLWQDIADMVTGAPWTSQLERKRPFEAPLIDQIFLGSWWKDDAKHWARLDGHAHRLDEIAQRFPATVSCLLAYTRFLYTIGQQSLPEAFKVVSSLLERGNTVRMASDSDIAFRLEILLRRFVYSEPRRLKSDPSLRNAILGILDALVAGGSSSAYRMRDDFVTPSAQTSA